MISRTYQESLEILGITDKDLLWKRYGKLCQEKVILSTHLAMAMGLAHVDKTSNGQSSNKADHPGENIEANCHEL